MKTNECKKDKTVREIKSNDENQFDNAILQLGLKMKFEENKVKEKKD